MRRWKIANGILSRNTIEQIDHGYMLKIYKKPPFPYTRPLSWSQLSLFKYSKVQWYRSYVLGEKELPSKEMLFGSYVDKKIQDDPMFLPEVPRCAIQQYKLAVNYNGIDLLGFPDQLDLDNPELRDDKTGKKKWDQKRADETGQLTMYLFMIYLILKIPPESFRCFIDWMPTCLKNDEVALIEPFELKIIETKRTMEDIVNFAKEIIETRKAMIEYYNKQ